MTRSYHTVVRRVSAKAAAQGLLLWTRRGTDSAPLAAGRLRFSIEHRELEVTFEHIFPAHHLKDGASPPRVIEPRRRTAAARSTAVCSGR